MKNNYSFEFNYFICLLTSLFNNINSHSIKRNDINKAVDAALIFMRSKGIEIKENKYSKTNLINNLYALGYINMESDENSNYVFQLLPTTIIKIEKSFDNNSQVYKLVGARTKLMIQKTSMQFQETIFLSSWNLSSRLQKITRWLIFSTVVDSLETSTRTG